MKNKIMLLTYTVVRYSTFESRNLFESYLKPDEVTNLKEFRVPTSRLDSKFTIPTKFCLPGIGRSYKLSIETLQMLAVHYT